MIPLSVLPVLSFEQTDKPILGATHNFHQLLVNFSTRLRFREYVSIEHYLKRDQDRHAPNAIPETPQNTWNRLPEADEPRDTKTREPTLQRQPRPEKNLKYNTHLRIRCRHVQSHARNLFVKRKSETSLQPNFSATIQKMPEPKKLEKSLKLRGFYWYELIKPCKCPVQDNPIIPWCSSPRPLWRTESMQCNRNPILMHDTHLHIHRRHLVPYRGHLFVKLSKMPSNAKFVRGAIDQSLQSAWTKVVSSAIFDFSQQRQNESNI